MDYLLLLAGASVPEALLLILEPEFACSDSTITVV